MSGGFFGHFYVHCNKYAQPMSLEAEDQHRRYEAQYNAARSEKGAWHRRHAEHRKTCPQCVKAEEDRRRGLQDNRDQRIFMCAPERETYSQLPFTAGRPPLDLTQFLLTSTKLAT